MSDPREMGDEGSVAENLDMVDHLDEHGHQEDEFGDVRHRASAASEAIIARDLARKYKNGPPILSREWLASIKPIQHVKNNWTSILTTSAAGGALAYGAGLMLSQYFGDVALDTEAIAKTAALSYPAWHVFDSLGGRLGFYAGHAGNAANYDRFREVKTEPAGKWIGRAAAIGLAAMGSVYGHDYLDTVGNVTYKAPHTITHGIPSAVIDTLTTWENTSIDPVWELKDQPGCLFQASINPNHYCLEGPLSDAIDLSVLDVGQDENLSNDTALSAYQRIIPKWAQFGL